MQFGAIAAAEEIGVTRARRRHAERLEKLCLCEVLEAHMRGLRGRDRSLGQAEIAIGISGTEAVRRSHQAEAPEDIVPVEAEPFELVARVSRQAAAMREEVAYRQLLGRIGLRQLEGRIDLGDAAIEAHRPVADERRDYRRRYRLRGRGELEHRIGIDRVGSPLLPNPEALQVDDLVLEDDGDGEAGRSVAINEPERIGLELRKRVRDLLHGCLRRLRDRPLCLKQDRRYEDGELREPPHLPPLR